MSFISGLMDSYDRHMYPQSPMGDSPVIPLFFYRKFLGTEKSIHWKHASEVILETSLKYVTNASIRKEIYKELKNKALGDIPNRSAIVDEIVGLVKICKTIKRYVVLCLKSK